MTTNPSLSTPKDSASKMRVTVLISGNGTNLQALIDAADTSPSLAYTIVRVISNRKAAYGLQRASAANIPSHYHNLVTYKKRFPQTDDRTHTAREEYDADLAKLVLADSPDLVVCAGWMHILTPRFLDPVADAHVAVINLHPALPGAFNGANAIERAWEAGRRKEIDETGLMIHYVISEVDQGEPILVERIPLVDGQSFEDLEERIHQTEWKAIVQGTAIAREKILETGKSNIP
jgi:phosphoribosylglycinamide formyltransferase